MGAVAVERRTSAFLTRCQRRRREGATFRLSQILSFGGLVVAEDSDGEDVALFEDIIRVEKNSTGDWSKETRQLLADGDALAAYKRRAFDLYRQRFAPEALKCPGGTSARAGRWATVSFKHPSNSIPRQPLSRAHAPAFPRRHMTARAGRRLRLT